MKGNLRVLAVVPARGGTDRVPYLNVKRLGDRPLLAHTLEAARQAASIDRVIVSTKASFRSGPGPNDIGSSRFHLMRACEGSLRRLGTDHVDLYQLHGFDALIAPFLVTTYELERRVLSGPLAVEMLRGVEQAGLIGVALVPGELERPVGVTRDPQLHLLLLPVAD